MANCTQCGSPIPNGQKICSMCYGDPDHGSDGYYRQYLEQQERRQQEEREQERREWGQENFYLEQDRR